MLKKSQFSISFMNQENLRSTTRTTFKNPNFQSLCELQNKKQKKLKVEPMIDTEKSWFSIYRWIGKLRPNLSFIVENKMENLHKTRLVTF